MKTRINTLTRTTTSGKNRQPRMRPYRENITSDLRCEQWPDILERARDLEPDRVGLESGPSAYDDK